MRDASDLCVLYYFVFSVIHHIATSADQPIKHVRRQAPSSYTRDQGGDEILSLTNLLLSLGCESALCTEIPGRTRLHPILSPRKQWKRSLPSNRASCFPNP
ncbi:hypothetical protein GGR53DRAFT_327183 [Hypoxylon sp. FL1150]|nr:hypothetical protein GGR53DRAFT_327183 [Hypoxylon sp. FL1150]